MDQSHHQQSDGGAPPELEHVEQTREEEQLLKSLVNRWNTEPRQVPIPSDAIRERLTERTELSETVVNDLGSQQAEEEVFIAAVAKDPHEVLNEPRSNCLYHR